MKLRRIKVAFLAFALCISSLLSMNLPTFAVSSSEVKKQISALESKLAKNKTEQAEMQNKIDTNKNEAKTLEQEISELDDETTAINTQLTTIDALIEEWEFKRSEEEKQMIQLQDEEKAQKERFDRMIKMSYEYGSDSYMELIFGAESFGDFLARLDLISYHLNYNEKVLKSLDETQKKLIESQQNYDESRKSIDEYKISQVELSVQLEQKIEIATEKKGKLMSTLGALQDANDKIDAEIDLLLKATQEKSKELKIIEASEIEARRKAEEERKKKQEVVNKNSVTSSSELAGTGEFIWPLPSSYTRISSGFSARINPITGKRENHNGLDLPAPARTKIYASAGGTVVIAGRNAGFGNCVTINHGNGYITLYGHCSSLNVTAGETVKQGDVIAFVGTTGISTGNHLHFTIYKDGVAKNPSDYVG